MATNIDHALMRAIHHQQMAGIDDTRMCVYLVTCLVNGKMYVGQTRRTVSRRWTQHKATTKAGRKSCRALSAAIDKHGVANFTVSILEVCADLEMLHEAERKWVAELGTLAPGGYNLTNGGEKQRIPSPETRARMSASANGRHASNETRAKQSASIRASHSDPIVRAKMSAARLGKKQSAEWVEKRANSHRGFRFTHEQRVALARAHMRGRKIVCADGRSFDSAYEAAIAAGAKQSHISGVCNGRRKTAGGLFFYYVVQS